jgi:hypothetical protein
MGLNNEYDFLLPDSHGVLLGDAKSEASGLGEYLKKAISFCLLDYFVRSHENQLGGFCFATPANPAGMFWTALRNAYELLTALTDCSGITGMNSQLIPADVKLYFRNRYLKSDKIVRVDALAQTPEFYLSELREKAGFTFRFLQVPAIADLEAQMQALASKARWATP